MLRFARILGDYLKKHNSFLWGTLILILTALPYSATLTNGFTNWDDNYYVTENLLIQSLTFDNLFRWFSQPFLGLYQPLILVSLALDYAIGGGEAWMFHLTNILLHLANIVLVFNILKALFKNPVISLVATFIFALHPLQVESVAWVTERKNLLYALFFLVSIYTYLKFLGNQKKRYYRWAILFFIAALLSKASAVVLPLVFMLMEYALGKNPLNRKLLNEKIPLFALSFIFGVMTLILHYQHGSMVDSSNLSTIGRLLLVPKVFATYLFHFLSPLRLSTYNPLPESISSGLMLECLLYFLLGIGLYIYLRIRKTNKIVIWGIVFFLINIGLFIIPPGVPVLVSDRYMYLAIIGPAVLVGNGIGFFITTFKKIKYLIIAVSASWILFLGIQTYQQSHSWKNSLSLWNRVLSIHGEQPLALIQRGSAYRLLGLKEDAMNDYSRSIEINQRFYRAYEYRGFMYSLDGDYFKAITDFEAALKQYPKSDFALASLGYNYRKLGQFDKAMQYLNKALELNPNNSDALINRGQVFTAMDQTEKACEDFTLAKHLLRENTEVEMLIQSFCEEQKD